MATRNESGGPTNRSIDLDEVARLVETLERDLDRARHGAADVDVLRGEVEQLRTALAAQASAQADVQRSLSGVRERMHALGDELFDDAVKGGDYIARIGRLLGM
jgi:hypothetical protein